MSHIMGYVTSHMMRGTSDKSHDGDEDTEAEAEEAEGRSHLKT